VAADYRLRVGDRGRLEEGMTHFFRRVSKASARPGDLLLLSVAADQPHLAVLTERGFVHADAGLRKVVETPGAPGWPVVSVWRRRKRRIAGE
jgi:murein DD-endopeptidase / murein LD-carboxypeptidase